MPVYSKPNFSVGVWAEQGTKFTPTSEKVKLGHVVEKPPFEIVNFVENRQDQAIAYLFQVGISDWDKNTTYTTNAFVSFNGDVYQAKSQNVDKQPNSNLSIWKIKWAKSEDLESLKNIVNAIRSDEGYLPFYVTKNSPSMYGKCWGNGYISATGLNASGSLNVGYGFNGKVSDGLYHNGTNPVIQKNGAVVAIFNPDSSVTVPSKDVVTMDKLLQVLQQYKVGDLYLTTNPSDPSVTLGYGTWERYGEGKALVGMSTQASHPAWTKGISSQFGDYTHKLTIAEMPSHTHDIPMNADDREEQMAVDGTQAANTTFKSNPTGGDQPHNNVQPSITVLVWRRKT